MASIFPPGPPGLPEPHSCQPRDADTPSDAEQRIAYLEKALAQQRDLLARSNKMLAAITFTRGWKVLNGYYRLRARLIPVGSRRWQAARLLYRWVRRGYERLRGLITGRTVLPEVDHGYGCWIAANEPGTDELDRQRRARFPRQPLISIAVPVHNTPAPFLRDMLESVFSQTYANWELCLADGGSREPSVRQILEAAAASEPRVKVRFLPANEGIAGNSNAALALATGHFVALLDHDDTLAPFALFEVVRAVNDNPDADFLYSDEDCITSDGRRRLGHHFKPDWSPDTLRSHNYICHLSVFRRELLQKIGGFRTGFEGAQDYDLVLRATEQARQIIHVPKILYHWRRHAGSTSVAIMNKPYAHDSGRKALEEHLRRSGAGGTVVDGRFTCNYQVFYPLPRLPLVSILIPSRDEHKTLAKCLASVSQSNYCNYEVLLVENHSTRPETFRYYEQLAQQPNIRLLTWTAPFNYAAVNNLAAAHARGEVLLFLNNDVQVINPDWLERLLEHALRPEVGAVGAKLYYPNDTIQHAGIVLGLGGAAGHTHLGHPRQSPGYGSRLVAIQNCSAVTGACLMTRKQLFDEVQGFDERFVLAYNDIDLCLKFSKRGYVIIWTPFAELYHHESKTRGYEDTLQKRQRLAKEMDLFQMKWGHVLVAGDPYYNPNLTLDHGHFGLRAGRSLAA
jgi:GT2 family glycosyltransferase